jgi:type II secretory pathway pseudopilin PulG
VTVSRRTAVDGVSGVTLIELVFVIVMLGVLTFVLVPKFDSYRQIELRTAVKDLAADLRYAQSQAIATRVRHGIVFDSAAERYTVYRGDPSTPASDFLDRGRALRRQWDRVELVVAEFDGAASIEFDSMGLPFNAAGNELSAAGFVVFTEGTDTDTVRVQALTGKVAY